MGDRGNIVIRDTDKKEVFLYSHWGGTGLPQLAQEVLRKNQRWNDPAYLARLLFCRMVKGQEDNELGYGISTSRCDYEHWDIVVNVGKQTVFFRDPKRGTSKSLGGFEQFCSLTPEQFKKLGY